jgi:hypothetical protein
VLPLFVAGYLLGATVSSSIDVLRGRRERADYVEAFRKRR